MGFAKETFANWREAERLQEILSDEAETTAWIGKERQRKSLLNDLEILANRMVRIPGACNEMDGDYLPCTCEALELLDSIKSRIQKF